jgi:ribonuclease VapC
VVIAVDTSALLALLLAEDDARPIEAVFLSGGEFLISTATFLEANVVFVRRGMPEIAAELDRLIERLDIRLAPFTPAQARIACDAYRRFGRGAGHPAALNFGDCFAYALAKEEGAPLLFKGDDFARTDVVAAV